MHTSPSCDINAPMPAAASAPRRLITDAPTRMFHWLFALSFAGAYITAESEHWRLLHVTLGYSFAGLLVFRLLYGFAGPRHAGLALLWRKLGVGPAWLRSLWRSSGAAPIQWRQGQNLGMALAIALMLLLVVPLTLSGYGTYNDWGDVLGGDMWEDVHEWMAEAFLVVVLAHLGLIVLLSVLRRQNLTLPMLTGRVHGTGPSPVRNNRVWLAVLLLLAVFAWGAWQWQASPSGWIPGWGGASTNTPVSPFAAERDERDEDD